MKLRGWSNGLAVAALIVTIGIAAAQGPTDNTRFWIVLGGSAVLACIALAVLKPRESDGEGARALRHLRRQLSARDVAFLRVGIGTGGTYAPRLSEATIRLAPSGEMWEPESNSDANARARKLVALGLMEYRGSDEAETTDFGIELVRLDDATQARRQDARQSPN